MLELVEGLCILGYFVFSIFSVYMVCISVKKPDGNLMGKMIYWNAYFVIIVMVATVILSLSLILSNLFLDLMKAHIVIGM